MAAPIIKPLGRKAYGHIAHLSGSRLGPGDHKANPGQERIATIKTRDRHDVVIVMEKLDGSNVSVARLNGDIMPLTRAGYRACDSPYVLHQFFWNWAWENRDRFLSILEEGERIVGEWLALAHGTRYRLPHEPFVVFDVMYPTPGSRKGEDARRPYREVLRRAGAAGLTTPRVLAEGPASVPLEKALELLESDRTVHGAIDPIEGAVWRVERGDEVDFLAKYVRPDKQDGCYLEQEIWNWHPNPEKRWWLT